MEEKLKIKKKEIPFNVLIKNNILDDKIVACWLNGKPIDLLLPIKEDGEIIPITLSQREGQRIYRRSLSFLFGRVVSEVFRDTRVVVNHSMTSGYYYEVISSVLPTKDELEELQIKMEIIVNNNEPIKRKNYTKEEVIKLFSREGREDVANLIKQTEYNEIPVYHSGPIFDFFIGPLVPSTGILKWFSVIPYFPGVVIHFPSLKNPYKLKQWKGLDKLFKVYHEQRRWNQIININNVSQLNKAILSGKSNEIIKVSEAFHEKKISAIADYIYSNRQKRLILISGPSSSGKTTFSRRLTIALLVNGLRPVTISLDNYFCDREKTPKDKDGGYDFEHPKAIDIDLFQKQVIELLNGKTVKIPEFDFKEGKMKFKGDTLTIEPGHPIIIEGIHAYNPDLTDHLPIEYKLKIYVSPLTQVNIDDHNRMATTDSRMIRRIVRDSSFRGYSPSDTIIRWPSIERGEKRWIFPYQEHADIMMNTSLIYEIPALKNKCEELLLKVSEDDPAFREAQRLLKLLSYYKQIDTSFVPFISVLREFIGGSSFKY